MNQSVVTIILALTLLLACRPDQNKTRPIVEKNGFSHQEDSIPEVIDSDTMAIVKSQEAKTNLDTLPTSALKSKASETSPKSKSKSTVKKAAISFDSLSHNFGVLTEGDVINYDFRFTNSGEADLEIYSAKGSCGCAQSSFPFIAIKPGESGKIGVRYNSVGKEADQKATIEILCNAGKEPIILTLEGTVKARQKEAPE